MFAADGNNFDMRVLVRLGSWGGAAVFALVVVVVASRSEIGAKRIQAAFGITSPAETAKPAVAEPTPQVLARAAELENETRRLADNIRVLSADRDRLMIRLSTVERNLDDMTGSIDRRINSNLARIVPAAPVPAVPAQAAALAPPQIAAPATTPIPSPLPSPAAGPAASPLPPNASLIPLGPSFAATVKMAPAPLPPSSFTPTSRVASAHAIATGDNPPGDSVASRTEFGVDIGGAANVDGLRVLWANAKNGQSALLDGLRPVVAIRENKPGVVELRLVIGPLANAGAAARLCASLAAGGQPCQQTVFDGQKLALR